jgi:predicted transcriptional regulator
MSTSVPSPAEVRAKLQPLTMAQLESLAGDSGVPFTTLVKVRNGQTENPRLDTVHAIWPRLTERDASGAADAA